MGGGAGGRTKLRRLMGKSDWLDWRDVERMEGRNINRFQIQMEGEPVSVESICPFEEGSSLSGSQDFSLDSQDSQESLLHLLLSQDVPIFKVISPDSAPPKGHYQQEILQHKILSYNRKEKSLEYLSQRFIQCFEKSNGTSFLLQQITVKLGVERRRMYDIINIFQSLKMVERICKNNYSWKGLKQTVRTITAIKQDPNSIPIFLKNKRQRSLERLAGLFLRFFIKAENPITLDQAIQQMTKVDEQAKNTKLRRLYDIVNVFKSLGLVEKVDVGIKKSGFKWLGTEGLQAKAEQFKNKIFNPDVKKEQFDTEEPEDVKKEKEEFKTTEKMTNDKENSQKKEKREQKMKKEPKVKVPRERKQKIAKEESKKENTQNVSNISNINDWFSWEERQAFSSLSLVQTFTTKKTFLPNIIRRETSFTTITGSHENINDISRQY